MLITLYLFYCELIISYENRDNWRYWRHGRRFCPQMVFQARCCHRFERSSKSKGAAEKYTKVAQDAYGNSMTGSIAGEDNFALPRYCDLLILSIPYEYINDTCGRLKNEIRDDCIVVSPIVPMTKTDSGFIYTPLEQGKAPAAMHGGGEFTTKIKSCFSISYDLRG